VEACTVADSRSACPDRTIRWCGIRNQKKERDDDPWQVSALARSKPAHRAQWTHRVSTNFGGRGATVSRRGANGRRLGASRSEAPKACKRNPENVPSTKVVRGSRASCAACRYPVGHEASCDRSCNSPCASNEPFVKSFLDETLPTRLRSLEGRHFQLHPPASGQVAYLAQVDPRQSTWRVFALGITCVSLAIGAKAL